MILKYMTHCVILPTTSIFPLQVGEFAKWSELWQMNISHEKYHVLHSTVRECFLMLDAAFSCIDGVLDFGSIIDNSELHWSLQCSTIAENSFKIASCILRALLHTYQASSKCLHRLVQTYFGICTPIWSPYLVSDVRLLEDVQRRFTEKNLTCFLPA